MLGSCPFASLPCSTGCLNPGFLVSPNVAILFCSLLLFLGSNSDQTSPSACISRLPHAITAQANRQKSDKEFWLPTLVHFLLASVHSSCSCPGSSLMMSYRFFKNLISLLICFLWSTNLPRTTASHIERMSRFLV